MTIIADKELISKLVEEVLIGLAAKPSNSANPSKPSKPSKPSNSANLANPSNPPGKITGKAPSPEDDDRAYAPPFAPSYTANQELCPAEANGAMLDLSSPKAKAEILLTDPQDYDALQRMKATTVARIGVGRCGSRLNTRTLLTLRADHAAARDGVFKCVDRKLLKQLDLFTVQTDCEDKNQYLTRPDLGRLLSEEAREWLDHKCQKNPDVQIYISDGLSSTAIEANLPKILPILNEGLKAKNIKTGTPFFLKYGRVGSMDHISELLGATVTCVLIGERPGLATAESMSAYIAYKATVGMPEARRTVVSNIHASGINAVEAGAYICDVIEAILKNKASGVELSRLGG